MALVVAIAETDEAWQDASRQVVSRVVIKGGSGAGKTTLGRTLASRLGAPYVELDALHHGPGWKAASAPELQDKVRDLLDDERGWVVDGNYDSKLGTLVLDRAELVVWLDLPLSTKLVRLFRRTAVRWARQEELWNGNRENLASAFWGGESLFVWAVRSHFRHRREWPAQLRGRTLIRLRTSREVDAWLTDFAIREGATEMGSRIPM